MEDGAAQLDGLFQALADPTRRAVLSRLAQGPASVSELAAPFAMALPSFVKHLGILEDAGCISTSKQGRVRTCVLETKAYELAKQWLAEQEKIWQDRTSRLAAFAEAEYEKERDS